MITVAQGTDAYRACRPWLWAWRYRNRHPDHWKRNNASRCYKEYKARFRKTKKCKEYKRKHEAKRRAVKRGAKVYPNTHLAHIETPCIACGAKAEHIDHIISLAKGGEHRLRNLWPLCARCNISKRAKDWGSWIKEKQSEH